MPGIVGLITKLPRALAEPQMLRMVQALRHESFYTTGTYVDESLGLYLGWTTLGDSFADRMPLRNELGDMVLVFSGEDFPEPGTAQRLKGHGHGFRADGPEYLVHLSEEDPSFPVGLNGRFHGLLADHTNGKLTLFNDRYGMHRVYYHEAREAFYLRPRPRPSLQFAPNYGALTREALPSTSVADAFWRTGRSLRASTSCRLLLRGYFVRVQSSKKVPTSSPKNGRTRHP